LRRGVSKRRKGKGKTKKKKKPEEKGKGGKGGLPSWGGNIKDSERH